MAVLLFCNVDADGKIVDSLAGDRVIPAEQYDYFFYIAAKTVEEVNEALPNYRVIDRELTTVEGGI